MKRTTKRERGSIASGPRSLPNRPRPVAEIVIHLQPRFVDPEVTPKLVVVRFDVGPDFGLDMLPYPTALRSCVTRQMAQVLLDSFGPTIRRGSRVRLTNLRVEG